MPDGADRVRIHSEPGHTDVWIECEDDVFMRCMEALRHAGLVTGTDLTRAKLVAICKGIRPTPNQKQQHLRDQIALAVCAVICCVVFSIFSIGLGTLVGWFS